MGDSGRGFGGKIILDLLAYLCMCEYLGKWLQHVFDKFI